MNTHALLTIAATSGLVVVYVDPLELEVRVSLVGSGGVYTVLIGDYLHSTKKLNDRHTIRDANDKQSPRFRW